MYLATLSLQAIALLTIITLLSLFGTVGILLVVSIFIDGIEDLIKKVKGLKRNDEILHINFIVRNRSTIC